MKTIYNGKSATIRWKILRTVNKISEDFTGSTIRMFLIGANDTYALEDVTVDNEGGFQILNAVVPANFIGIGVYDLKAVWVKSRLSDDESLVNAQFANTSRKSGYLAVVSNASEDNVPDSIISVSSFVESYGRDGLTAFEIAVLRGVNGSVNSEIAWASLEAKREEAERERIKNENERKELWSHIEDTWEGIESSFQGNFAGYQYMGIATPSTTPDTKGQKVFFDASRAGVYTNFGNIEVNDGEIAALMYDGSSWRKEVNSSMDYLGTIKKTGEYLKVVTDSNDRMLESIDNRGDKTIYGNLEVKGEIRGYVKESDGKSLISSVVAEANDSSETTEWLKIMCDNENRIVFGVKADGTVDIPKLGMSKRLLTRLEDALVRDGFSTGGSGSYEQIDKNKNNISNLSSELSSLKNTVSGFQDSVDYAIDAAKSASSRKIMLGDLGDDIIQKIESSGGGSIVNAADGEDLTTVGGYIKFANRAYDLGKYSGRGEYILRKNINDGKNVLDVDLLRSKVNTTFVVKYDFEIPEGGVELADGVKLKFDGGSFKGGEITVRESNEFISVGQYQCFYECTFKGSYSKTLPLSMFGVIADGTDKYKELSSLKNVLVEYAEEGSDNYKVRKPVFENVSIDGTIICGTNGVNIPASVNIVGVNSAKIEFTSPNGDYCMSISANCTLSDITLSNATTFNGVILTSSSEIYDLRYNLYGSMFLTLNNVTITGAKWADIDYYKATGLKIEASTVNENCVHYYYTRIKMNNVNIQFVGIGVHLSIINHPVKSSTEGGLTVTDDNKFAWGNEVNADILYVSASECGILQTVAEMGNRHEVADSGYFCINNFEFQALAVDAVGFDISTVKKAVFIRFNSWDNNTFGCVRDDASVEVITDFAIYDSLTKGGEIGGFTPIYGGGSKTCYKIYSGKLKRGSEIFNVNK